MAKAKKPTARRGTTLAVANMKGGVGKTTLSIMIAESIAVLSGNTQKVLLIDLDAQGSLSYALAGETAYERCIDQGLLVTKFFKKKAENVAARLREHILPRASLVTDCTSLDLIPVDSNLLAVERQVIANLAQITIVDIWKSPPEIATASWLKTEIDSLRNDYDWIILDCPPGISIFAYAGISCADKILIPMTPDFLSMQAIRTMNEKILPPIFGKREQPEKFSILNKCRAGTKAVRHYREELIAKNAEREWVVTLIDVQLGLIGKLADATNAEEDRKWSNFRSKFDPENCQAIIDVLGQ